MKTVFLTIALDAMPFIAFHYPMLRRLDWDWQWIVVEGVALPKGCTAWCAELEPRLSRDGTTQHLDHLARMDSRITVLRQESWPGKVAMLNAALDTVKEKEYLLWELDSDEIWSHAQWTLGRALMLNSNHCNCAYFKCRYFVGPDWVITSKKGYGNRTAFEWRRLWKMTQGVKFETHEPPVLTPFEPRPWEQGTTEAIGLVFDHYALATEEQVKFKRLYYGSQANKQSGHLYDGVLEGWKRLQSAESPVDELALYLPFVGRGVKAERVTR